VDPFDPPVEDYEELLVVDAFLSDDNERQVIRLSLSSPIDTARYTPVTGANVVLSDDEGNTYDFLHESQGNYYSIPGLLELLPGRFYTLTVSLGAERYVSDAVQLKITPPITDVYYDQETFVSGENGSLQQGLVILADSESPDGEPLYLRYDWEETFMTVAPFPSNYIYDNETESIELRSDNISDCWISRNSTGINILTTEGLADPDIREHPIRYLSFNSEELNFRYSILVKQYALDVEGYEFWKALRETNESTGTLFDVLPFPLTANITNVDDPTEPVLGYFDISTASTQRIYIDRTELPTGISIPTFFQGCTNNAGDTLLSPMDVPDFVNRGFLISYYVFPTGYILVPRPCIGCTIYGSNVKPDFWE